MKPRMKWYEWIPVLILVIALLFTLYGCGSRGSVPGSTQSVPRGPAGVLTYISLIATAVAGSLLIACAFLAVFYHDKLKVAKLAIACVTVIVGSQIVYWLGSHLVLASFLALLVAAGGAGLWVWVHRRKIEVKTGIDINRDGKIGT